jgi:peptide-methionine (S)-S-oxide reductase
MNQQTATFGGGCFWCTEALFLGLKGVASVTSGYTGGTTNNPTYEQVCEGTTGHVEAIQITFDPAIISYERLVEVFLLTHDPTTPNRQGHDIGTQYRSAIFFHDDEQRVVAEKVIAMVTAQHIYDQAIVTEITPSPSPSPEPELSPVP